jgi:hypothetical protein
MSMNGAKNIALAIGATPACGVSGIGFMEVLSRPMCHGMACVVQDQKRMRAPVNTPQPSS